MGGTSSLLGRVLDDADAGGKDTMVVWGPQANMIDTLVTRHVEQLAEWKEFASQRKKATGSVRSYRPAVNTVRGRQGDNKKVRAMFTLGRRAQASTRQVPTAAAAVSSPSQPTSI